MNRDKAKEILQIHPADADPGDDPEVQRALRKLNEDESLNAWYEQEKAFDRSAARKLREFPVPAGLREEILHGSQPSVVSFPWVRRGYAAAAAILLIAVAWSFLLMEREESFSSVEAQASRASPEFFGNLVSLFERDPDYDHFSTDLADLRQRVKEHRGPDPDAVFPASLGDMNGLRCRVFEEEQKKVALICMEKQDSLVHLFVIEESRRPSSTSDQTEPRFTQMGDWSFADWDDSGKTCVLATRGPKENLKPFF